jgi:hypothetical protein
VLLLQKIPNGVRICQRLAPEALWWPEGYTVCGAPARGVLSGSLSGLSVLGPQTGCPELRALTAEAGNSRWGRSGRGALLVLQCLQVALWNSARAMAPGRAHSCMNSAAVFALQGCCMDAAGPAGKGRQGSQCAVVVTRHFWQPSMLGGLPQGHKCVATAGAHIDMKGCAQHTACPIMEELASFSQWKEGMWIPSRSTHVYTDCMSDGCGVKRYICSGVLHRKLSQAASFRQR